MGFLIFLVVAGIIILFVHIYSQISKLQEKIEQLEWDSAQLSKRFDSFHATEDKLAKDELKKRSAAEPIAQTASPESTLVLSETSVQPIPPSPTIRPARTDIEGEQPKSRTREEWESFIGGKLLNRIGALALIIGLGFFLKYAFDNNWISETVRVLIGVSTGIISLGLAYRTHRKGYQIFSQGLTGAGIAILYLSVYASFNFYVLVPQWAAFLLMSIVTAMSLALGIYYNSFTIGMLGWAGGFLTPIMLSTGTANEIGLLTYIALLDVGLLAVVFLKNKWGIIEPLTLAATWIMYFAWYYKYYQESDLIVTVFFISVFWMLFFGLDFARLQLLKADSIFLQHFDAAFNSIIYYIVLYILINFHHHDMMSGLTIALAGIYIGAFWLLTLRTALHEIVIIRYVLTAIMLAIAATAIQFENFRTVIGWSIEAAALLWVGIQWKKQFVSYSALALFLFAAIKLIFTEGTFEYIPIESFRLLFNERCLAFLVLAVTVGFSAYLIPKLELETGTLTNIFHFAWCIILFTLVTVETADFFQQNILAASGSQTDSLVFMRPMVLSMVWLLLSIPLLWIGLHQDLEPLIISSLCLLTIAACTLFLGLRFVPLAEFIPFWNIRTGAFVLALLGVLLHYWRLNRLQSERAWIQSSISPLLYLFSALLFTLITVELNDFFRRQMIDQAGEIREILAYSRVMTLTAVWAALSLLMVWFALKFNFREFLFAGLCILFLSVCFAVARGIEYVPAAAFRLILNTRLACGLFVLAVMFVQQSLLLLPSREIEWKKEIHRLFQIGMIILSLVLLTGETRDFFEQQIVSTQAAGDALRNLSNLEQLSLSAVWLLYSLILMFLGFWRSLRSIRVIAFVLFGFTILKIFIYDLSYLETLYRIFSFIGLGLILLAVSYAYQRYKDIIFAVEE